MLATFLAFARECEREYRSPSRRWRTFLLLGKLAHLQQSLEQGEQSISAVDKTTDVLGTRVHDLVHSTWLQCMVDGICRPSWARTFAGSAGTLPRQGLPVAIRAHATAPIDAAQVTSSDVWIPFANISYRTKKCVRAARTHTHHSATFTSRHLTSGLVPIQHYVDL